MDKKRYQSQKKSKIVPGFFTFTLVLLYNIILYYTPALQRLHAVHASNWGFPFSKVIIPEGSEEVKIEKINDNQIRCTLTRQDLESHQIRLSELAYGTEKAKQLFRDMIEQAHTQFGFEADNIPLMIEAIPVSAESIVLIITKVEDPEELDTRFSKFAPFRGDSSRNAIQFDGADSILDLIQKLHEGRTRSENRKTSSDDSSLKSTEADDSQPKLVHLFTFRSLDNAISASHGLRGFFKGRNSLYREASSGRYSLVLHQDDCSPEDFNKVCNILSEYGDGSAFSEAGEAYLREHAELISDDALAILAEI